MKVTRIAYSAHLNPGKYAALVEQARRLGRVRSEVWQRYGSILAVGSGLRDRQVRDRWLADGIHVRFGVLANAWKETVRDAIADIAANMEAAKVDVRRAISRRTNDPGERKRMFTALRADQWASDPFLARQMREHWKRGRNRTQCGAFGRRSGDRFHCTRCGVVWQADVNAAINILHRAGDPTSPCTPHTTR
ncbi:zinc ribbon domain-containing protein [Micromonospora sp. NPDC047465]|uniref:zinc ribbon domain-containing protein n=1 Tax=Micromonospora sp. NPDC047465 TaxID=3154813 RepID=UPI0033F47B8D